MKRYILSIVGCLLFPLSVFAAANDGDLYLQGDPFSSGTETQVEAAIFDADAETVTGVWTWASDIKLESGSSHNYWWTHNSTGTQLKLWSTNCNGGGTDCVVVYVPDGTDDPVFSGNVTASIFLGAAFYFSNDQNTGFVPYGGDRLGIFAGGSDAINVIEYDNGSSQTSTIFNPTQNDTVTDATTAGDATLTKTGENFSITCAIGDIVYVYSGSTAGDFGFATIVSVDSDTQLTVDKTFSGSDSDVDFIVFDSTSPFFDTALAYASMAVHRGRFSQIDKSADAVSLTAIECSDTLITTRGWDGADDQTFTLPEADTAVGAGLRVKFLIAVTDADQDFYIDTEGSTTNIYLDGTAIGDGERVWTDNPTVGESIECYTATLDGTAYDWFCDSIVGTWLDKGS